MPYGDFESSERGDRLYRAAVMSAPFLEREREVELARRWRRSGDEAALRELTVAYARFVVRLASQFRGYGLPQSDLVQEGNVGLMEAAARFDPERNVCFATYAAWWIVAAIQDYVLRNTSLVRVGTTGAQKSLFFSFRRIRARYLERPDAPLDDADRRRIADDFGVPLAVIERMDAQLARADRPLHAPAGEPDGTPLEDRLPDPGPSPEQAAIDAHDGALRTAWLDRALARLGNRERQIIIDRYLRDKPQTLKELGQVFGVSKERIRQIEHRALDKLRAGFDDVAGESGARDGP